MVVRRRRDSRAWALIRFLRTTSLASVRRVRIFAAFITFTGSVPGSPGVGQKSTLRRWGHYDTEIPVYVLGFKIQGRLTTAAANGSYILQIKSFDVAGGLTTALNQGEIVNSGDFNTVTSQIGVAFNFLTWWRDFNFDNVVNSTDFSAMTAHLNHTCSSPNNP
jgi:hypothetical protein